MLFFLVLIYFIGGFTMDATRLGIAAGRDNCCVHPQPLLNKVIKVKDNKQKPKDACPAVPAGFLQIAI